MNKMFLLEVTEALHAEESLDTLHQMFKSKYDVKLCLGKKTLNKFSSKSKFDKEKVGLASFLFSLIFKRLDKDDIVVFPTISVRNVSLVFLISLFSPKNIYYIRNSNSWLKNSSHAEGVFCRILTNYTTFLKKIMLKRAYQVFVANTSIKNYLLDNFVLNEINIVPYKFYIERNVKVKRKLDSSKLNIVVPGAIHTDKKNLSLIRSAFNILDDEIKRKVTIVLLGKPSRKSDFEFCESWKSDAGDSLIYFNEFVSDEVFSDYMEESDCILGVLNINYFDKYNAEIYGLSKDTGIDAQAISYGKPLIINNDFNVINEIISSTLKFHDEKSLAACIFALEDNVYMNNISDEAILNCNKLSLDKVISNLVNI